jgi:DNA (cytosine-5)-methyltransferase 1
MTMKTAIDLFCGCGAVTSGLKTAGFRVVGAVDVDPIACATYRLNHKNVKIIKKDIKKVDPERFRKYIPRGLDLLAVCAPCQPFSSRNRKQTDTDDRVNLILESLRFIEVLMPTIVFFENVPGLWKKSVFQQLTSRLSEMGYHAGKPRRIDAVDLGVPQRRQRMILIGAKSKEVLIEAEKINNQKRKTVFDAIGTLPVPPFGKPNENEDSLHFARQHSPLNIERLQHIPKDGGSRDTLPEHLQLNCHKKLKKGKTSYPDSYGRLKWNDVAPTLTTGCTDITRGRYAHPEQDRAITLREAARLQTFSDKYVFTGNSGQIATQIGNAVPPEMMAEIARVLYSALSKNETDEGNHG